MPQIVGYSAATAGTPQVTATSGTALAANPGRRYAYFCNDSDAVIYLGLGAGTALAPLVGQGIRLGTGAGERVYEMGRGAANVFAGVVQAITASGTKSLIVLEG